MFIELLDVLRCVRPHEDAWLVGSFDALVDRHIIRGTLGCPVCSAEYPIRNGVVHFAGADAPVTGGETVRAQTEADAPEPESALRLAALLGLAEPGGIAVLTGRWAGALEQIEVVAPGVLVLVVNPAASLPPLASAVTTGLVLPMAAGSVRAVALDSGTGAVVPGSEAVRVLKPAGRLIAPVAVPVPEGVTEIARDEHDWVAQRDATEATGPVLRLTRRVP